MLRREDVLIVDGYNMIGAWPELERLKLDKLEDARDRLLDLLANYQSYAGMTVYVVFDAFRVPGLGAEFKQHRLNIVYTREKETADECIERLVGEMTSVKRNLYVATSDQTEQRVAFGRGALRLSARELRLAVEEGKREIEAALRREPPPKRNPLGGVLKPDVQLRLELMRRGQSLEAEDDGDG
ncbi:NYN domain-containing protein [Cohnella thailandensis]|uniref:NYN domain-containing protein n=1 Tax=Cohnella thailandensis TaxID=557557 RepID=A0A841SX93_9BACL|nr:NYN domain-containing protein [Cohnella thailandensis]MBB6636524.1 NYN domain-containing protein [Cohnella thailandensis]MBP1977603.1 putative RNA-binding protein with PIN domain [Cohnella thailandensis]